MATRKRRAGEISVSAIDPQAIIPFLTRVRVIGGDGAVLDVLDVSGTAVWTVAPDGTETTYEADLLEEVPA